MGGKFPRLNSVISTYQISKSGRPSGAVSCNASLQPSPPVLPTYPGGMWNQKQSALAPTKLGM